MIKISDAEFEVMKIIWKKSEVTSMDVVQGLNSNKWKINTIRTLIKRLLDKGAIEIIRQEGNRYIYKAAIDENEYRKAATKDLVKKLYNNSVSDFVAEYCENNNVTSDEIKEVIRYIDERDKKKKNKK